MTDDNAKSSHRSEKAKVVTATIASVAAAFGLVAVNPHVRQNEVGEWSVTTGADQACAADGSYQCYFHPGYVCSPNQDYNFINNYLWATN